MQGEGSRQRADQQQEQISLSYYNAEHYAAPTAYRALRNIEREQQMKRPPVDVTDRKKVRTQVIRYD